MARVIFHQNNLL